MSNKNREAGRCFQSTHFGFSLEGCLRQGPCSQGPILWACGTKHVKPTSSFLLVCFLSSPPWQGQIRSAQFLEQCFISIQPQFSPWLWSPCSIVFSFSSIKPFLNLAFFDSDVRGGRDGRLEKRDILLANVYLQRPRAHSAKTRGNLESRWESLHL